MLDVCVEVNIGSTYTVNWNGTDYDCVCSEYSESGLLFPALGNIGRMSGGEDSGEPFILLLFTKEQAEMVGGGVGVFVLDGSQRVTLSVQGDMVQKMDARFLPEMKEIL